MEEYLKETKMLNYSDVSIQNLIKDRKWNELDEFEKIKSVYNYVRDEIVFGYNVDDDIPASKVLQDGYGQCNTKATLFMALLRAVNIPCRIHAFTIDKKLQKGAMTALVYKLAPKNVLHTWVEVLYEDNWYNLEGIILDKKYLNSLQNLFKNCKGEFYGYGIAVEEFENIDTNWNKNNTYIQSKGINNDYGIYNAPDEMLKEHQQKMSGIKKFMYRNIGRHLMNRNVKRIRNKVI